jgi:hypothetical protein
LWPGIHKTPIISFGTYLSISEATLVGSAQLRVPGAYGRYCRE